VATLCLYACGTQIRKFVYKRGAQYINNAPSLQLQLCAFEGELHECVCAKHSSKNVCQVQGQDCSVASAFDAARWLYTPTLSAFVPSAHCTKLHLKASCASAKFKFKVSKVVSIMWIFH